MNTLVVCYSFTGNNSKLAMGIAKKNNADYWELKETKRRSVFTILLDLIFYRYPGISEPNFNLSVYEQIVLVAPVWFGKIASPIRSVFKQYKNQINSYSVVSLSAGFDGAQTNLEREFVKLAGAKPRSVLNLLINDLLPENPKPSRNALDKYRLNQEDVKNLVTKALN